jgi:hypothetical protein
MDCMIQYSTDQHITVTGNALATVPAVLLRLLMLVVLQAPHAGGCSQQTRQHVKPQQPGEWLSVTGVPWQRQQA